MREVNSRRHLADYPQTKKFCDAQCRPYPASLLSEEQIANSWFYISGFCW
jgi:hypothetical protein